LKSFIACFLTLGLRRNSAVNIVPPIFETKAAMIPSFNSLANWPLIPACKVAATPAINAKVIEIGTLAFSMRKMAHTC